MEYKTHLDKLRHSCSHIMAQAVVELWSDTKVAIGPAIEDGFYYDFEKEIPFTDIDLKKIEKRMKRIIQHKPEFVHSTMSKKDALVFFKDEKFKVELINALDFEDVSVYKTGEAFTDLCKGPHIENASEIKAFKLLSVAGSYWRGDENKEKLQRIYGTAFETQKELDEHIELLEEAKKRDHRKLGVELELFNFYHESCGAGLVFYLPAGAILRKNIEDYVIDKHLKRDYDLVITPHILKGKLWEQSGHAENYRENMYWFDVDKEQYALKPMNCPGHSLIFKSKLRSYKDLPVRFFELGTVYRQEKAGVLHGLLRVRGFTQDDAHIFCQEDQIQKEVEDVIDFVFEVMTDFGFSDINIELSTRPEKSIGSDENWEIATKSLEKALINKKLKFEVNVGDGAFYGPKIDFKLRDSLKREWQCATIQCDFSLPERFDLTYINTEGKESRPIMIHRAILGSIERFIGTLIEHYAGAFPVWLSPTQVVIIPINEKHHKFCNQLKDDLQKHGLRGIMDSRNESLGKRIRENTIKKIPYILVIGDNEVSDDKVSVRKYGIGDQGSLDKNEFINKILEEANLKK